VPVFAIDPDRSQVWIEARSTLHPIRAESAGLEGWFEGELGGDGRVDLSSAPTARLTLPVRLLSSGNVFYDNEMRRRIEARKFPVITGDLTEMTAREGDRYLVSGDLTFRGVTRSYTDEMSLSSPDGRTVRLEGSRVFDIRDFGMEAPRMLGLRVDPEVVVTVVVVAGTSDPDPVSNAGPAEAG
jgi:polyisoprenoid-binding protein YceI